MRHLINNTYDLFELMKSKVKLFFYATKTPLDIKGYFETTVESGNKITFATAIGHTEVKSSIQCPFTT